jgi:hypothetical protein
MFDETLVKDLVEMYGKSLSFSEVEAVGGYLFKDRSYSIHAIAGMDPKRSISPLNAAKILVDDAEGKNRLKDLFAFTFELDGSPLNNKIVRLDGLENLMYRLARSGQYYDFDRRRFVDTDDYTKLINWGALRDRRDYPFTIASVDICSNSEMVKKHTTKVMEKVYFWSWARNGGIFAFPLLAETDLRPIRWERHSSLRLQSLLQAEHHPMVRPGFHRPPDPVHS